jgi:hypothetical protein
MRIAWRRYEPPGNVFQSNWCTAGAADPSSWRSELA